MRREKCGPVRAVRLPSALENWFERHRVTKSVAASETLAALVHGGLRLREGYMAIHRRALEELTTHNGSVEVAVYLTCLGDTFSPEYVEHLLQWLSEDGFFVVRDVASISCL